MNGMAGYYVTKIDHWSMFHG